MRQTIKAGIAITVVAAMVSGATLSVAVEPGLAKQFETAAKTAQSEGNYSAALREYRRMLELYPNEPGLQSPIYLAMSEAAEKSGEPEQAKQFASISHSLDPALDARVAKEESAGAQTRGGGDKAGTALAIMQAALTTIAAVKAARTQQQPQQQLQQQAPVYPQAAYGQPGYPAPPANGYMPMPGYQDPNAQMAAQQPGYQPQVQPGYAQPGQQPGYQPQATQPGYAPQQQPGYQPQATQPGYAPPQQPGYQPQATQPGYAPQQQPGYQPQATQPGYTPQQQQPGYQPQVTQPGYAPQQQPGYQPQVTQPGYAPQQQPGQPQVTQPGYTPQQPGYQPQATQPGYAPPPQTGYQPQGTQPGYAQQQQPAYQPQGAQPGSPQQAGQGQYYPAPPADLYRPPNDRPSRAPTRGEAATPVKVVHDHSRFGDKNYFESSCGALLTVEGGDLTFTAGGAEGPRVIPAADILEIRMNTAVGRDVGAFHIITKKGLYLHLALESGDRDQARAAVDTLRQQLGLGQ